MLTVDELIGLAERNEVREMEIMKSYVVNGNMTPQNQQSILIGLNIWRSMKYHLEDYKRLRESVK